MAALEKEKPFVIDKAATAYGCVLRHLSPVFLSPWELPIEICAPHGRTDGRSSVSHVRIHMTGDGRTYAHVYMR